MSDPLARFYRAMAGGYPHNEALIIKAPEGGPAVVAFVPDLEVDVLPVRFFTDGEIQIDTENYTYISLASELLELLAELADDAAALWDKLDKYWRDDRDEWVGWEHLATPPLNPAND